MDELLQFILFFLGQWKRHWLYLLCCVFRLTDVTNQIQSQTVQQQVDNKIPLIFL